jgi:hypothetical protein
MKKRILYLKYLLSCLTLAVLCGSGLANAQTSPNTMASVTPDITQRQLSVFDNFLDNHPELAEQLRKDPSLVNNPEFVENHPALQQYLQEHPEIREEIKENPNAFMRREDRYDRREADSDRRGDRDITRGEVANMDRFLDRHPEIAEQLKKDPSLIDKREFIENHPELKEFLAQHPELREQFKEHPYAFMHREERFDASEADRDPTRRQLASMDRFMDSHPEIAEQLRKDPSLLDNKNFVAAHPALQDYLQQHPEVRQEVAENPNAFMRQEQRFDRNEDNRWGRDHDTTRGELASFHEFLGGHSSIASQLAQDPQLAKNQEYMENHPELQQYLQAHPGVREELKENPQAFLKSAQQFNENTAMPSKGMAPKTPAIDPKPKQ